jgi:hypothetical protein
MNARPYDPKQEYYALQVQRQLAQERGERDVARGMAKRQRQLVAQNKKKAAEQKAKVDAKKRGKK